MIDAGSGLYAQLLGLRWSELADALRRLHEPALVEAVGVFRVQRGTNWLARALAWLARLPAECQAVPMRLVVTPISGGAEEWRRHFGGQQLVSKQVQRAGLLCERLGWSELTMTLDVVDGALHYKTNRAALRIGCVRIPLPSWLGPCVTACEKAGPQGVGVTVEVRLPLLGRLIAYEGTLTSIECKSC